MFARSLIAAPFALVAAMIMVGTATPVAAAQVDCAAVPANLRAAAATAEPAKARKALMNIRAGEALCAADAAFEAGRKFRAAATVLGVDTAQLAAAPAAPTGN